MGSTHSIGAAVIPILIECIRAKGVSPLDIEERTGISRDIQDNVDIRIPIDRHIKLWQYACEVRQDPALPINIREEFGNTRIHFVNILATNSSTALEGLENWKRYARIVSEAIQAKIEEEGDRVKVIYGVAPPHEMNPWMPEHAFFQIVRFGRELMAQDFVPLEVWFRHGCRGSREKYEAFFGSTVKFDQPENAILCLKKDLLKPLLSSNPHLQLILEKQAEIELDRMAAEGSFVDQVKKMIAQRLSTGSLDIESVAESFNMSRTTLYRKLKAEATSYNSMLTEIRKEFAIEYIKGGMNVSQIAFLLGYSTASNFVNAFKHWFGKSPGAYRLELGEWL